MQSTVARIVRQAMADHTAPSGRALSQHALAELAQVGRTFVQRLIDESTPPPRARRGRKNAQSDRRYHRIAQVLDLGPDFIERASWEQEQADELEKKASEEATGWMMRYGLNERSFGHPCEASLMALLSPVLDAPDGQQHIVARFCALAIAVAQQQRRFKLVTNALATPALDEPAALMSLDGSQMANALGAADSMPAVAAALGHLPSSRIRVTHWQDRAQDLRHCAMKAMRLDLDTYTERERVMNLLYALATQVERRKAHPFDLVAQVVEE